MITDIFFDFDGVLCESVAVKTEAFRQLYLPYGEDVANAVVSYHEAHGGVSRYDKIRYYHKNLLQLDITDEEMQKWADRFSALVMAGVVGAAEVPGTSQFLHNHKDDYRFYVITATPTDEIKDILQQKGWSVYFCGVYGSPEKKNYWAKHILETQHLNAGSTVFVGDALTDEQAADEAGLTFILRRTDENKMLFPNYNGYSIKDNTELLAVLKGL